MLINYSVNNYILDKWQMEVLNWNKDAIVIAGAGSGKTLTILGKINFLLDKKIVNQNNILVISFTNASVNDIKCKLNFKVDVFTFHKLAINILSQLNYEYKICDNNMLPFIIKEEILTCSIEMQKNILKFVKYNNDFNHFCHSTIFHNFCNLIETFINLWKTNNFSFQNINLKKFNKLEKKIMYFIFTIYKKYINEKRSMNVLDFDDLILLATKSIENANLLYKYIIIDEFQDTSMIRLNLVKSIYEKTNSKIIVVGDDWQSIYRFSGCNLKIFLNFQKFFPNAKTIKLTNTYRNSQELINIATAFIKKNPDQIDKILRSTKKNDKPLILVPYKNKIQKFKELLDYILQFSDDIMILSRNNQDIYSYLDHDITFKNDELIYKGKILKFFTVHKSKGLEANYVVVLNCNDELLGFPNKIENNIILEKIFSCNEIPYAEERRLFYVALTRCKEKTFLVYDKEKPSIFILEIKKLIKKELKHIEYFK